MQSTDGLIAERGKTHGSFLDNARISQGLKQTFRHEAHWENMHPVYREAIEMIALKLSRILSGQHHFKDHWDDIAGYATLAAKFTSERTITPHGYQPSDTVSIKPGPSAISGA